MSEYPFSYSLGDAGSSSCYYKKSQLKDRNWEEIKFPVQVYLAFLRERGLSLPEHWEEHLASKQEEAPVTSDDPAEAFFQEHNCDAGWMLPVLREWVTRPEERRTAESLVRSLKLKNPNLSRKQVESIERVFMPRGTGGAGNKKPFNLLAVYDKIAVTDKIADQNSHNRTK